MVICLERGADLHIAQVMPLPLTVSCFSKIQIGFTFLVPAYLGSPGIKAVKRVCVCVCYSAFIWDTPGENLGAPLGRSWMPLTATEGVAWSVIVSVRLLVIPVCPAKTNLYCVKNRENESEACMVLMLSGELS